MKIKIPIITLLPGIVLRWLGRRHAKTNRALCEKKIASWIENEKAVIYTEIKAAKTKMKVIASGIKMTLCEIESIMLENGQIQNEDIRERRKNQLSKLQKEVIKDWEELAYLDDMLEDRLSMIDHAVRSKLNSYKAGMATAIDESQYSDIPDEDILNEHKGYQKYKKRYGELQKKVDLLTGGSLKGGTKA